MRKRVFGRQLKRDTNERKALFKNLMTELVLHEKITTTEEKAKAIRAKIEKLITKAKKKGQQAEYLLQPYLSADAVKKMIADFSSRFAHRSGGYTRIVKLGNRFSDNASMAVIELVDKAESKSMNQESGDVTQPHLSSVDQIQEAEIITEEPKKEEKVARKIKTIKEEKQTEKKTKVKKEKS